MVPTLISLPLPLMVQLLIKCLYLFGFAKSRTNLHMVRAGASTRCAMRDVHVFGDLGSVWYVLMIGSRVENSSFVNPYGVIVVDDDDDGAWLRGRLGFMILRKKSTKLGLILLTYHYNIYIYIYKKLLYFINVYLNGEVRC